MYQGGEVDPSKVEGRVGAAGLVAHELVGVDDDGALDDVLVEYMYVM